MAEFIHKIKNVSDDTRNTIFGYLRAAESLFPQRTASWEIPAIIKAICTAFYNEQEILIPRHEAVLSLNAWRTIIESPPIINGYSSRFLYRDNVAFGSTVIVPSAHRHSVFQWKLKLLRINDRVRIGIITAFHESYYALCSSGKLMKQTHCVDDNVTLHGKWGRYYAPTLRTGDVVTIEFNVRCRTLRYFVNGINLGIAFRYLDPEATRYNLAVSLRREDKVELMHFQEMMSSESLESIGHDPVVVEKLCRFELDIAEEVILLLMRRTKADVDVEMAKAIRKEFKGECIDARGLLEMGRKAFLQLLKNKAQVKLGHGCKVYKYLERAVLNRWMLAACDVP